MTFAELVTQQPWQAAFGAAVGAFAGQQLAAIRLRKVVNQAIAARLAPLVKRIRALEKAQGWEPRENDRLDLTPEEDST